MDKIQMIYLLFSDNRWRLVTDIKINNLKTNHQRCVVSFDQKQMFHEMNGKKLLS